MSWWAVGITAAMGAKKGMDNEARMDKNDKFRKEAITYSPWTGMGDPGSQQLPGMLESGVSGGLTGAMLGNAMGNTTGAAAGATIGGESMAGATAAGQKTAGGLNDAINIPQQGGALNFNQAGPYTAMGGQGSAGAMGAQNNPYMKNPYSKFGPVG